EEESVRVNDILCFVNSDLGRRMSEAAAQGRLHREQPFVIRQSARKIRPEWNEDEMILVQGIMDAWFQEGEELILVDYKTDYVRRNEKEKLREKYQVQLESYADALERMTGRKVREKIIYSFALGQEILIE